MAFTSLLEPARLMRLNKEADLLLDRLEMADSQAQQPEAKDTEGLESFHTPKAATTQSGVRRTIPCRSVGRERIAVENHDCRALMLASYRTGSTAFLTGQQGPSRRDSFRRAAGVEQASVRKGPNSRPALACRP